MTPSCDPSCYSHFGKRLVLGFPILRTPYLHCYYIYIILYNCNNGWQIVHWHKDPCDVQPISGGSATSICWDNFYIQVWYSKHFRIILRPIILVFKNKSRQILRYVCSYDWRYDCRVWLYVCIYIYIIIYIYMYIYNFGILYSQLQLIGEL